MIQRLIAITLLSLGQLWALPFPPPDPLQVDRPFTIQVINGEGVEVEFRKLPAHTPFEAELPQVAIQDRTPHPIQPARFDGMDEGMEIALKLAKTLQGLGIEDQPPPQKQAAMVLIGVLACLVVALTQSRWSWALPCVFFALVLLAPPYQREVALISGEGGWLIRQRFSEEAAFVRLKWEGVQLQLTPMDSVSSLGDNQAALGQMGDFTIWRREPSFWSDRTFVKKNSQKP